MIGAELLIYMAASFCSFWWSIEFLEDGQSFKAVMTFTVAIAFFLAFSHVAWDFVYYAATGAVNRIFRRG